MAETLRPAEKKSTGKVVVAAIVLRRNQSDGPPSVLLSPRKQPPDEGKFMFPGGFATKEEISDGKWAAASLRELREETGIIAQPEDVLAANRVYMQLFTEDQQQFHQFRPFNVIVWEERMGEPSNLQPNLHGRWEWKRLGSCATHENTPSSVDVVLVHTNDILRNNPKWASEHNIKRWY